MTIRRLTLSEQIKLLDTSIHETVPLHDVLDANGYCYDDLLYRHNKTSTDSWSRYITLDDIKSNDNGIPFVSFFSGAGGFDLGFECAGFQHAGSFEINDLFCKTIKENRPNWHVTAIDMKERDKIAAVLREEIGLTVPFDGVFHGGPPCQPFSIAANQRYSKSGTNFKRIGFDSQVNGNLLFDYVWLIEQFRPAAFIIENVPGLITIDNGQQITQAIESVRKQGYEVARPNIINARNYGVPQSRERVFIVGWRNTQKQFVFPTEDLHSVPCGLALRNVKSLPNHVTRKHKAQSVMRYMELAYGKRDPMGRVDRLDPCLPSKTVIAGGMKGGGRSHLHPSVPRTLSPRESARLQTFPDDYEFCGPPARQLTQVGNAVPPLLGAKIAQAIRQSLFV